MHVPSLAGVVAGDRLATAATPVTSVATCTLELTQLRDDVTAVTITTGKADKDA